MRQLSFLSPGAHLSTETAGRRLLDAESERLLDGFQAARVVQGAHPRSIRREVAQLRSVAREAGTGDGPAILSALVADPDLISHAFREPKAEIARSTGRARLLAVQRFIQIIGPTLGRDPGADLAALDARLPTRRSTGWHTIGTLVAGTTGRRRRRGPTLDAADLRRIVDAAGMGGSGCAPRDRALVALHCFSGLRAEEIVRLQWEDLATELTVSGHYELTATIQRNGGRVTLLLPGPASDAVEALADVAGGAVESLFGSVFCSRGTQGRPLSYRSARDVLQDTCHRAGFQQVDSVSLRAAYAHWLRCQGLSDHEVAAVLGLTRVRSVDRLLRRHAALDAQRVVREALRR